MTENRDKVRWAAGYDGPLGDIFCLTFVRGVAETEALHRMGALGGTLRPRTVTEAFEANRSFDDGYPDMAMALSLGAWTVLIEPFGFQGAGRELLGALSLGGEGVAVLRHDYATDAFGHAVAGMLMIGFDPRWPSSRWGTEPDRLNEDMRAVGLDPETPVSLDDDEDITGDGLITGDEPITGAMLLAERITQVLPSAESLGGALLSAQIERWFSAAAPSEFYSSPKPAYAEAIDAAPPRLRRSVAVGEVRRLAGMLDEMGAPGLAEALAAAERGEEIRVATDSELGRQVRVWLTASRVAGQSMNDSSAPSMGAEARARAFHLGWLAGAVRGALWSDAPAAAYAALHPLMHGPEALGEPGRDQLLTSVLRGTSQS